MDWSNSWSRPFGLLSGGSISRSSSSSRAGRGDGCVLEEGGGCSDFFFEWSVGGSHCARAEISPPAGPRREKAKVPPLPPPPPWWNTRPPPPRRQSEEHPPKL